MVFGRGKNIIDDVVTEVTRELEEPEIRLQVTVIILFVSILMTLRLLFTGRTKSLSGERVVDMHALNDVNIFKEVFLCYLNAAILEPILAIAGSSEQLDLVIDVITLAAICWWLWILTDAFDWTDLIQFYKFHVDLREERDKDHKRFASWFQLRDLDEYSQIEKRSLVGSVSKDVSLWFLLACITAAWIPDGKVGHCDVLHAYVIVFFWIILHHYCRRATAWSSHYFVTLLHPSMALMPLEYCLPLMDVADTVEDLEFIESYREFIIERVGVELTIKI